MGLVAQLLWCGQKDCLHKKLKKNDEKDDYWMQVVEFMRLHNSNRASYENYKREQEEKEKDEKISVKKEKQDLENSKNERKRNRNRSRERDSRKSEKRSRKHHSRERRLL
ncbi:UNVERIFIED_CONTAM: hypothetical protein NCL1_50557 [Trichonephila clavipes]